MGKLKIFIIFVFVSFLLAIGGLVVFLMTISANLPDIMRKADYHPLLVSEVYARGGEKIGEFFRENRRLIAYEKIPPIFVKAFLSAEDNTFFEHKGFNPGAILRASLANLKAGHTVQGGSTITQQVAKSLLLTPERTLGRKIRELILAFRMEQHLSKEDILFLYLNQIYFGEGAYGIAAAADTYFRKTVDKLTLSEMALLAGLPQAPSKYSPVGHPDRARERQRYVLQRMATDGVITDEEAKKAMTEPMTIYMGKEYKSVAPYFVETVRQTLIEIIGESKVLDAGLKIYTSVDYKAQQEAQNQVREGLREVDKRQGYRGAVRRLATEQEITQFLLDTRKTLQRQVAPIRVINAQGNIQPEKPLVTVHHRDSSGAIVSNIPSYIQKGQIVDGVVTAVDDQLGIVTVRFAEGQGLIDVDSMGWARKPDPAVNFEFAPKVKKPSIAVKAGDVILVKVESEKFYSTRLNKSISATLKKGGQLNSAPNFSEYALLSLEQEPAVEGALISYDLKTQDVIAMVGGYDFKRSEFNRAVQAARQTGSSFKSIIYAAALDRGYTPASPVQDSPIVFKSNSAEQNEGQDTETKTWKPHNYGNKFTGDILFRNALIRSLNIPTVKILEDIGIDYSIDYARRLGIFSPLNKDLSLGLGSSGVTLYEMTKAFGQIARGGLRLRPSLIKQVLDHDGKPIKEAAHISLDRRFAKELSELDKYFDEKRKVAMTNGGALPGVTSTGSNSPAVLETVKKHPPVLFFENQDQLISPSTAYLMTTLLSGVINEEGGTAGRARALGRPAAGKTGTTNGYFDTWFIGYTPNVATGVWVGFDSEKSLGVGEAGGRTALPIWLEYMKYVHNDLPVESFAVPEGIVFANIDNFSGKLASASSTDIRKQAFVKGTEPRELNNSNSSNDDRDFLKEDLSDR